MAKKVYTAIMGFPSWKYEETINLGGSIYNNIYNTYADSFPNPTIEESVFKEQYKICLEAQAKAIFSGSKLEITYRNEQVKIFYYMMSDDLKPYVNRLYKGDKTNLERSAFHISKRPAARSIPCTPSGKRVINGPYPNSVKIMLNKLEWPKGQGREVLFFFVYMTSDPDSTDNLKMVCKTFNSQELIVENVPRGVDMYYYVTAQNTAGESELSQRIKYMRN